ncbi:MAG: hypothetical protein ABI883_09335, partial [Chthoniobacterales bacterium]
PHYLMLLGVVLTALYMTRQMIYVFYTSPRATNPAHESPRVMTIPLLVLAGCTIALSVALTPAWPWLYNYLLGEPTIFQPGLLIQPMLFLSAGLVAAGIGLGFLIYRGGALIDPIARAQPALFRFLANRMWLDEIYHSTVLRWSAWAALVADWMDRHVWDGFVRATGGLGQLAGIVSAGVDGRALNAGADESATIARAAGRLFSRWHSGQVQNYLRAVGVGALLLLLVYAWLA